MKWFLCSVICLAMLLSCMALPSAPGKSNN